MKTSLRLMLGLYVLAVLISSDSIAREVEPGVQYAGETRLEFSSLGASFVLPAGWVGGLPPDSEFFIMQNQAFDAYIFASIDEATVAEARQLMSEAINVGDGVVLHPAGEVHVTDSLLVADYSVSGSQVPLVGQVRTIVGEHGLAVAFIAASTPENADALRSAMSAMSATLTLEAPPVAAETSAESGGPWLEQLNGYKLTHFFTRTGYTEEDYIWLCPGGRFYKSFNSGGFGGGASGAFESKNGGTWSVAGPLESGTLLLVFNDGSSSRYNLTLEGTKLFLDDKRYFREADACR